MEEKEEHDKVVENIVKKLAENNLYVKLEKCKSKRKKLYRVYIRELNRVHSIMYLSYIY